MSADDCPPSAVVTFLLELTEVLRLLFLLEINHSNQQLFLRCYRTNHSGSVITGNRFSLQDHMFV